MPVSTLLGSCYLCGDSGSGKEDLLTWILYGLCRNQEWGPGRDSGTVVVIDANDGETVDNLAQALRNRAPERWPDVEWVDFSDPDTSVGFNPLSVTDEDHLTQVGDLFVETQLKMLNLRPQYMPESVYCVRLAVEALAEANLRALSRRPELHLTLLQLMDFFTNPDFRRQVMRFCSNATTQGIFGAGSTFDGVTALRLQMDFLAPASRSIDVLSRRSGFANVFGQSQSQIDVSTWVRDRKIVLIKLPSITGPDSASSRFIGTILTAMISQDLLRRSGSSHLSTVVAHAPEIQRYTTQSYMDLMMSARERGTGLLCTSDVPEELPRDLLHCVMANTQTKIAGRLSHDSARDVAHYIAGGEAFPTAIDMASLQNREFLTNLRIGSAGFTGPLKVKGLPDLDQAPGPRPVSMGRPTHEVLSHRQTHLVRAMQVMDSHH